MWAKSGLTIRKADFQDRVEKRVATIDFEPSKPLNLKNTPSASIHSTTIYFFYIYTLDEWICILISVYLYSIQSAHCVPMYLNCHTYFSLRFGTISSADLARQAAEQGVQHLALTDINNTSATYDFLKAARDLGLHAIPGIEFRNEQNQLLYIGIGA